MSDPRPTRGPVAADELLTGLPDPYPVPAADIAARLADAPRLAVLDDDPTGTQTVSDVPVLTTWEVDDLRWAVTQPSGTFFVLTNTRSLPAADAEARNREVLGALAAAAEAEGVEVAVASRSDSTLRGHFPLETDVLAEELRRRGDPVDGVVIVPAYPDAGRITVQATHWARTAEGMLPAGDTEFAQDASFGYRSSDLRAWVAEKTAGRVPAEDVLAVGLTDIRVGGPDRVAELLGEVRGGRNVVVDAVCDDDLRVLALALLRVEAAGARLLYRVGPGFVRARSGQAARPALTAAELRGIGDPPADGHGLIAVGSHVGLTTGQLDGLRALDGLREVELNVPALLDERHRGEHIADVAAAAADAMREADVVIRTSRDLVTGAGAEESLAIARAVSSGLVEAVTGAVRARRPAFVVAKGGITSSDIATEGLRIRRAVARGTMLPGIVSLWEPVSGDSTGIPYIVFPGNVGDRDSLAEIVTALRAR
ncbi:hypothetical protein IQ251_04305 [Saccharopolyspora sp. HNM0983]|uniref:Hydroxyacid dehydrogenase n=1 Tax=Saccharopolyspora montiporae TaxID=2781240 RepID=A0A929B9K5_9PSEU|nr:four-carbon acid sugar kinase family protein [Saccharopolyspora sp. HNM0983]MBE9373668.1 hypothetical protein [Saccharopolyspora sp. HNM0983]